MLIRAFLTGIVAIFLHVAAHEISQAASPIGEVTRIQGVCEAQTEGQKRPLDLSVPVNLGDIISTGGNARLEIKLDDDTVLTLGENAEMTLHEFVYSPASTANRIKLNIAGAFRFVSGNVTKGQTAVAEVTTPAATIGIRGTDFWGGPIDGSNGVFLLDGIVEISNAQGSVTLDEAGEGTSIAGPDSAPEPVVVWPQDKVDRAVATITFQ